MITPDDMSNLFRFFRVPTPLYTGLMEYATNNNLSREEAILLHSVHNLAIPGYSAYGLIDITQDWERTQPKMYKQNNFT